LTRKYVASFIAVLLLTMVLASNVVPVRSDSSSPPLIAGAQVSPNLKISIAGQSPELTWTAGQPYPVVNGKPVPPPTPPPISSPSTPGGHYWVGCAYPSAAKTHKASWLRTRVWVPSVAESETCLYYVILSSWDTANSNDQVGFAGNDDMWGLAYSYSTGPWGNPTLHYSYDALMLTPGQPYAFFMTSEIGPGVWLEAYLVPSSGSWTEVWASQAPTGAANPGLTVQYSFCGDVDYQETYGTPDSSYPNPYGASMGLFFYFDQNYWGTGTAGPPWTATKWVVWASGNAPSINHSTISSS